MQVRGSRNTAWASQRFRHDRFPAVAGTRIKRAGARRLERRRAGMLRGIRVALREGGIAVNQFTLGENKHTAGPDVVLFVNGVLRQAQLT